MKTLIKRGFKSLLTIVLFALIPALGFSQVKTITGNVVDANDNAIENVKVFVTGFADTVLTGANGDYTIEVCSKSLEIDYLAKGFKPASSSVGNQNKIDIVMVNELSKVIYDISLIDLLKMDNAKQEKSVEASTNDKDSLII